MCKKLLVVGLLLVGGTVAIKSSSYVGTMWHNLCKQAEKQVPRDFKIDEVRYQLSQLDTEIEAAHGPIAEKMVEAQELSAQVKAGRANLTKQAQALEALTQKVEAGAEWVVLDQSKLTSKEAQTKMTRDLHHFQATKALLEQKEQHLKAVQETVADAKQRLSQLRAERAEFARELAEVELREQKLKHEQTALTARKGSDLGSQIKTNLATLKRSQAVDEAKSSLDREFMTRGDTFETQGGVQATPEDVRRALHGKTTPPMPKVAQSDE